MILVYDSLKRHIKYVRVIDIFFLNGSIILMKFPLEFKIPSLKNLFLSIFYVDIPFFLFSIRKRTLSLRFSSHTHTDNEEDKLMEMISSFVHSSTYTNPKTKRGNSIFFSYHGITECVLIPIQLILF